MDRIRAVILTILINGCGAWSTGNIAMEGAYGASMVYDWHQTVSITHNCSEINPVIGRCGDRVPPWAYFPLAMMVHISAVSMLKGGYRTAFQGIFLGIEMSTIFWNANL